MKRISFYKYLINGSIALASLFSNFAHAQLEGPAIGKWRAINSYYSCLDAAEGEGVIYCGTTSGLFAYDIQEEMHTRYSKVEGMHDVEVTHVAYNLYTNSVLMSYANSNIDILDISTGEFRNVPDLMISTLPGDRRIHDLLCYERKGYISTGMGLVVLDIGTGLIEYTTPFFEDGSRLSIWNAVVYSDEIYVATNNGIWKTSVSNPYIQDYTKWEKLSNGSFQQISYNSNGFYGLRKSNRTIDPIDSVFILNPEDGTENYLYSSEHRISTIQNGSNSSVWVGEEYRDGAGRVALINSSGVVEKSYEAFYPTAIIEKHGELFFTDKDQTSEFGGLRVPSIGKKTMGITPSGPESVNSFDIWAEKGELLMAHGGHDLNWVFNGSQKGFSTYLNKEWRNYGRQIQNLGMPLLSDASRIHKDKITGNIIAAMAMGGLIELKPDGSLQQYTAPYFDHYSIDNYIVSGIAQDKDGNLWFSNVGAAKPIRVKMVDGSWHSFGVSSSNRALSDIIIDDFGNKWSPIAVGGGVVVFSDNGTITNTSDDLSRWLRAGVGNGNLRSNVTHCIAKDQNGSLWIGTNSGISIIDMPNEVLNGKSEAYTPNVQHNNEPVGPLFGGKTITSIAVDGNNNKWVGTQDAGVWLVSPSGEDVIHYFNTSNSPLPHNQINSIDIDPYTGDVYFSTGNSVVVYKGNAIEKTPEFSEELIAYPNPVPSGYNGMIAFKDLKGNNEIRITDINGQLVAQFSVYGGQAVWNGRDYTGRRPQSGVYLIMVTDKSTGKTVKSGKIIIHE